MDPHSYRLKANGLFNLVQKLVIQNERQDNNISVTKSEATFPTSGVKNICDIYF